MSQVSYGTITITDTNDIENIYMVYAGSSLDATAPDKTNFNLWKTDITQVSGDYIWQRTVVKKSGVDITSSNFQKYYGDPVCITGPEGDSARNIISVTPYYYLSTSDTQQTGGSWSTTPETYPSSGTYYYWTKAVTAYDSGNNTESSPVLDGALNSANETARSANQTADEAKTIAEGANSAISDLNQYFWRQKTATTNVPAGSYVTNIPGTTYKNNPASGGFNSLVQATGIFLRNGINILSSWTGDALVFYQPTAQGKKTIELSANALRFYNPTDGTTEQAVLDANGLILKKGGLEAGSKNTTDYIYVWSHDDATNHTININNSGNKPDWRIVAGNKFGVDKAGNLYASNATISGAINANEGYIGGWQIGTDGNKSLHNGSSNTSPTIGNSTIILSKGLTSTTSIAGSSGPQTWTIAAGTNFGVTTAGKLYATGAEISGDLTASSLKINGNNYLNDITTISSKASINAEYSVEIITSNFNPAATADYLVTLTAKVTRVDGGDTSGLTYQWFGDGNSLGAASTTATSYNVPYNTTYTTFTVEIN